MERDVLQRLLDQAFLYDDPSAYQAGVHAAWGVLARENAAAPQSRDQSLREASAPASAASAAG